MYAVVRSGGRQHKVSVGDVLEIDKTDSAVGESLNLQPLMVVDGESVLTTADALSSVTVTAEVLGATKGPKIHIHKFKNKTGYHKRQGHRQRLTDVVVRDIKKG